MELTDDLFERMLEVGAEHEAKIAELEAKLKKQEKLFAKLLSLIEKIVAANRLSLEEFRAMID